jgi:phosphoglycerate dehydrogenase-like enzyme
VPYDSPLLKLENTAFSPHLGTSVMETRIRMAKTAAEDVIRVLHAKEPLYSLRKMG